MREELGGWVKKRRGPEKLLWERSRIEREGRRARERGMEPERPQEDRLREVMWERSSQSRPNQPAVPLEGQ